MTAHAAQAPPTTRPAVPSPLVYARVAGLLYLIIAILGGFAYFFAFQTLVVPGDATATASNITASESLFRFGFAGNLVVFLIEIVQPVLLYVLLRPVSNTLALIMMLCRLAMAAVMGVNLLNLLSALLLLSGTGYLRVFEADQLNALALLFLDAFQYGYDIALVFFGLHLFALGYLVYRSGYFPRVLGVLLVVASLSYLIDSFAGFLFPGYDAIIAQIIIAPTVIAELSFALWLLVRGVNVQRYNERAQSVTGQGP
jgi:hypothetical protein